MTTGCVRSTLEPEHRLMIQESMQLNTTAVRRPLETLAATHALASDCCDHFDQELPENLMDGKSKRKDDKAEDAQCSESHGEDQLKKPRRKDTPILNSPPQIPGVRPLKVEKPVVHLEDEEKDMKD